MVTGISRWFRNNWTVETAAWSTTDFQLKFTNHDFNAEFFFFFFLHMRLRPIVDQPGNSIILAWNRPRGQDSTMRDIVWVSHRVTDLSFCRPHSALDRYRNGSGDHCCRGRVKPSCRIVESSTRWIILVQLFAHNSSTRGQRHWQNWQVQNQVLKVSSTTFTS